MDPVLKLKVAGFAQNTVTINVKMFQIEYRITFFITLLIGQPVDNTGKRSATYLYKSLATDVSLPRGD